MNISLVLRLNYVGGYSWWVAPIAFLLLLVYIGQIGSQA